MPSILAADIHMTSNPRDEYRWGLFEWLEQEVIRHKADQVFFLGDHTEAKDRHQSILVNRFSDGVERLRKRAKLWFLKGNHDYIDPAYPFFGFLDHMSNVSFIKEPTGLDFGDAKALCLPTTRSPEDWTQFRFNDYALIFTHQTYDGAISENGTKLPGFSPSIFNGYKGHVWSGDIHVPQKVAPNVEYVGAPYRIDFGDRFTPRCVLLKEGRTVDLHYPCVLKRLEEVTSLAELKLLSQKFNPGDLVKVRVKLRRSEYVGWSKMRDDIKAMEREGGWQLFGPELVAYEEAIPGQKPDASLSHDPKELVAEFARKKKLSKAMAEVGQELIDAATGR